MFSIFFKQALGCDVNEFHWCEIFIRLLSERESVEEHSSSLEVVCETVFLIGLAAVELAQRVFKDGSQNKPFS